MDSRIRFLTGAGCLDPPFRAAASCHRRPTTCIKQLWLGIAAALGLGWQCSGEVCAQDAVPEFSNELILEEVIVTGTRIVRADGFGQTSPVAVVDMDAISSSGFTRVEDILNNLPQFEADQTSFRNMGSTGTGNLDLRGLGAERTLVLINGRRMQPGGVYAMSPDINQVPTMMLERVEVLTGGASATYGADAVAGVVNFIMRRVNGAEVSAGINGYQHDNRNRYIQDLMDEQGFEYPTGNTGIDGKSYNLNIAIGGDFADGRGNATAYANWRKNDGLLYAARDYASCPLNSPGTACGGSGNAEVPNFFIAPLVGGGPGPYGYDARHDELLVLQPDSSLKVDDRRNPSNLYNYAPVNYYMRPDERWSFGVFAKYEIDRHALVYFESMGFNDRTVVQLAESATFFDEVFPLPLSNAYFPENFRKSLEALWPGEDDFGIYIGKRNTEGGPRISALGHTSFRVVAGIKGTLGDGWSYDVSYLRARTASTSDYRNDILKARVAQAVDSRLCEPDPACIPYQVFTYQGVTSEAADSLSGTGVTSATTATEVLQAYVTGNLRHGLPAGDIMAVAGYERRKVDFERVSDRLFEEGLLLGLPGPVYDLDGRYAVDEIFIEANIPLLADRAHARNMTLDIAYRYSGYSTFGGSSTYRLGLDWQVLGWLRFRSGYNRAVRTPNIAELHTLNRIGAFVAADPCAGPEPVYSLEQCARTGVTPEMYGQLEPSLYGALNALYGGNPELEPEKAKTLTAGLVFDIGQSMRLSADYWDIVIDDVIAEMEPYVALRQCALNGILCDLVHRGPGGSLWWSNASYVGAIDWNLGSQHSSGIDIAWAWAPGDHWRFNLMGTWYLKKETTVIADQPDTRWDCAGKGGWDGEHDCPATPKWRHSASVTYDSSGSWSLTGRWRYYGKVSYIGNSEIAAENLVAQNYMDLNTVFMFGGKHDLTLGVNNIFDKEPPLVGSAVDIQGFYDPLGRFLFSRLTLRW